MIELIDWRGEVEYPTDVVGVAFEGRSIVLTYRSGKVVTTSLEHFPFLAEASVEDRSVIELGYSGIIFPRLEDALHTESLYDMEEPSASGSDRKKELVIRKLLGLLGIDENTALTPENPTKDEIFVGMVYGLYEALYEETYTWEEVLAELEEEDLID